MSDYKKRRTEDARLIILRALAEENSYSLNEALAQALLETFGIDETRDWVRNQFKAMAAVDAVTTRLAGTVMIAVITNSGLDHVKRRIVIEGITRPSPEQ